MTERDGQVDPQPHAQPVRPAMPPLRGANIVAFASSPVGGSTLTYEIEGRQGYVHYQAAAEGSVTFKYTDPAGTTTSETYQSAGRRPPAGPGEGGRRRPPRPGQNPPPRDDAPAPATSPRSDVPQLTVTSPAFQPGGYCPVEFTCDGAGISPPLEWRGAPVGTNSLAISVWHVPRDGGIKSYWVVYNIPATVTSIAKTTAGGGTVGVNDKNRAAYDPMCSKGPGAKKYNITVYALSAEVKLSSVEANRKKLLEAIQNITLAEGTLAYQYDRQQRN